MSVFSASPPAVADPGDWGQKQNSSARQDSAQSTHRSSDQKPDQADLKLDLKIKLT
jgi:hypothetical protein